MRREQGRHYGYNKNVRYTPYALCSIPPKDFPTLMHLRVAQASLNHIPAHRACVPRGAASGGREDRLPPE